MLLSIPWRSGTPRTGLKLRQGAGHTTTSCHASLGSRPRLFGEECSNANTCLTTLDSASPLGRAPTLSRVLRLRSPPSCWGGLRHCHVCCGSGPRLPAKEGSIAAVCPTTLDPASLLRRALGPPRVSRLSVGRGPQEE
jgi:hypothetical protein